MAISNNNRQPPRARILRVVEKDRAMILSRQVIDNQPVKVKRSRPIVHLMFAIVVLSLLLRKEIIRSTPIEKSPDSVLVAIRAIA
jgi:hypothetical protein